MTYYPELTITLETEHGPRKITSNTYALTRILWDYEEGRIDAFDIDSFDGTHPMDLASKLDSTPTPEEKLVPTTYSWSGTENTENAALDKAIAAVRTARECYGDAEPLEAFVDHSKVVIGTHYDKKKDGWEVLFGYNWEVSFTWPFPPAPVARVEL